MYFFYFFFEKFDEFFFFFSSYKDEKNAASKFEIEVKKSLELFRDKESESNWEKFDNAFKKLIEITREGVSNYEKTFISGIKSLKQPIQNSVSVYICVCELIVDWWWG